MSYQGSEWARKLRGVKRGEKAVLMQIGCHQDQRTNVARVSVGEIAFDAGMSKRQVIRILRQLEEPREGHPVGIVRRIGGGNGRGNSATYCLVGFKQQKGDISRPERMTLVPGKDDVQAPKGDIGDIAIRKERETKELQDENQFQEVPVSSSQKLKLNMRDDDAGGLVTPIPTDERDLPSESPDEFGHDIARILRAFESSPVTTGKASVADRKIVRDLLYRGFSVEQIEDGILLASARRAATELNGKAKGKVQSLAYFVDAIAEASEDQAYDSAYKNHLRHWLNRYYPERRKHPESVGA